MPHQILIVDPDEAFGQMLVQMLSLSGDYDARSVSTSADALSAVQSAAPDLAIIDLSLSDQPPLSLIDALRQQSPSLRLMLIPLGDSLPAEYGEIAVQGVLTKPFFIGDLGEMLTKALGTETRALVDLPPPPTRKGDDGPAKPRVRQIIKKLADDAPEKKSPAEPVPSLVPTTARPPAAATPDTPRARRAAPLPVAPATDSNAALDRVLSGLATEVRAEALLVMRDGILAAQRSSLPPQRIVSLTEMVGRWLALANEMATLAGEPYGHFRQLHFEGDRYHVYALDAANGVVVVMLCRSDVPLGTVRLAFKTAVGDIVKLVR